MFYRYSFVILVILTGLAPFGAYPFLMAYRGFSIPAVSGLLLAGAGTLALGFWLLDRANHESSRRMFKKLGIVLAPYSTPEEILAARIEGRIRVAAQIGSAHPFQPGMWQQPAATAPLGRPT